MLYIKCVKTHPTGPTGKGLGAKRGRGRCSLEKGIRDIINKYIC